MNEGVARIYESMEKSMLSVPEYSEKNGNVHLILRNKIRLHSKTIQDGLMLLIEREWNTYNETQRRIITYLFVNSCATLDEIVTYVKINENTVRTYLNTMIEEQIVERISTKLRDKNAKYQFRKNT